MQILVERVMFAVFVLFMVGFVFLFVASRPFWSAYNDLNAKIIANSISTGISALSVSNGSIEEEFNGGWDIKISKEKLEVSHEKAKSGEISVKTQYELPDMNLINVKRLSIRNSGNGIVLRKEG